VSCSNECATTESYTIKLLESSYGNIPSCQNSLNCCRVHENVVQKFKLKRQEMTGETRMSLAVVGRKRQTVQTAQIIIWQSVPKMKAATGDERRPTVDRRYGGTGMSSCSVNDDRRRRRPGTLDTGTSWFRYGGAIPFNTRYAMQSTMHNAASAVVSKQVSKEELL